MKEEGKEAGEEEEEEEEQEEEEEEEEKKFNQLAVIHVTLAPPTFMALSIPFHSHFTAT